MGIIAGSGFGVSYLPTCFPWLVTHKWPQYFIECSSNDDLVSVKLKRGGAGYVGYMLNSNHLSVGTVSDTE